MLPQTRLLANIDAERACLGAMMFGRRYVERGFETGLAPQHFYLHAHRVIAGLMYDNWYVWQVDDPVDAVSVKHHLERLGRLEEAGGEQTLISLMEACPAVENVAHYASLVTEMWRARAIQEGMARIVRGMRDASAELDVATALAEIKQVVDAVEGTGGDSIVSAREILSRPPDASPRVIRSTGFSGLDLATGGGFRAGQFYLVSGDTKSGKTTLMTQMVVQGMIEETRRGADPGRTLYFSLADLQPEDIVARMMENLCGYSAPPDDPAGQASYNAARNALEALDIDFLTGRSGRTVERVCAAARAYCRRHTGQVGRIVIDYAQKLSSDLRARESAYDQARFCSDQVAALAEDTGVVVIVGSQVTPGASGAHSTKGSRTWQDDAAGEFLVERGRDDDAGASIVAMHGRFWARCELPVRWSPAFRKYVE